VGDAGVLGAGTKSGRLSEAKPEWVSAQKEHSYIDDTVDVR
jgi:hypothetical protein